MKLHDIPPHPLRKGFVVRHIRLFGSSDAGNVAVMFGLALVPILGLAGGAVDLSRRASIASELQAAADVAALAGARAMQAGAVSSEEEREALRANAEAVALKLFESDFVARAEAPAPAPVIEADDAKMVVSANLDVPSSFLNVIGIRSLPAAAYAEVAIPEPVHLEIALVLDYSISMGDNNKYVRMTNAARAFIAKVAAQRAAWTKVGIVPFSAYVLATVSGRDVRGTPAGAANSTVNACLTNRDYPYSATSDAPYVATEASRWPKADGSQCSPYHVNSLGTQELTDDFTGIADALLDMRPTGLTNISLATEMGWHLLTPEAPFESAGVSTPERPLRKVLILLTDGKQTIDAMGPSGGPSRQAANETTAELCANMEAAEITVFTIAYDLDDEGARTLLTNCASEDGSFSEASTTEISAVFNEIYDRISETETVWLSR